MDLPDKRDADDLLPQITAVVRDADRAFERAGGSTRHWVRDCFLPLLARAGLTITAVRSGEPDPRDAVVEEGRKIIDISWDAEARQWLATGINPPGLVTGAPTIAELWRKIAQIVPALDAAGRQGEEQ